MNETGTVQDVWAVETTHRNELGKQVFGGRKGFLELPHPMTVFDAADHAIRAEIRDAFGGAGPAGPARAVHAVVWAKRDKGREPGRYQACGALAEFDRERGRFMRATPWFDRGPTAHEEIGCADGAIFHVAEWS